MKYVNSLKYMNSFENAEQLSDISSKRVFELCALLGRVNVGTNAIYLPSGAAGHATAVMLESVIIDAGYKVGRITAEFGFDSRNTVYLNGAQVSIEDYNTGVAEIKSTLLKASDQKYLRQEVSYALALLICKMNSCDYVLLEGMSVGECDLASICAPYELVIAPVAYSEDCDEAVRPLCDAIKCGVREVISGNQKKAVYDMISRCVSGGVRLNFTSKTSFKTESVSSIGRSFSYGERDGYTVKSASKLVRDCTMLVVESALAMRRKGVKMPWTAIMSGIAHASGMAAFETLSVSPLAIFDGSSTKDEVKLLLSSLDEVFGYERPQEVSVCIPSSAVGLLSCFESIDVLMTVGGEPVLGEHNVKEHIHIKNIKAAEKQLRSMIRSGKDVLCFGSVAFASELKAELTKA